MAKLGELYKITSGGTPSRTHSEYYEDGTIPWVKTGDLKDKYLFETDEKISQLGLENSSARIYLKNTVLLAMYGATIGATSILKIDAATNQACAAFSPREDTLPEYLYAFLESQKDKFIKDAVGGAQPNLSAGYLKTIEFKLPSLEQQTRITRNLSKIDELLLLRKQQIAKLDELVKARFFEMFGEISDNSMNWDCFTIGKLISTIESGWSGNGKQREKHADEIAVLKVSAVTKGYFIPTECKVLDDQHNIKKYVYPQKGDILFSRANTKEMVGATVLIKKDYPDLILPDKLWKIRFCTDVNPIYMKHVLSTTTVRNAFSAASTGTSGSMYNVSMEKFKGVIIPVPPLSVQNKFAAFVERVDQQKQTVQQSLEKLELMKKALMQEYFG